MVKIPENVLAALADPKAVKVLTSVNAKGQPHSIVCGSINAPAPNKLIVAEILMKTTSANLKKNDRASILVLVGMASYQINVKVKARITEGPLFDGMNKHLAAMKLRASAVWTFMPTAVFDQSANPNAGTKLA